MQKIRLTMYKYTGKQGIFTIPERACEECDIMVQTVKSVMTELGENKFSFTIKPWWLYFWKPFLTKLAWHPPILIVENTVFCQGVIPNRKKLKKLLQEKLDAQS